MNKTQNPMASFAVYSPNEAAINDGAGFWNSEQGWVTQEFASVFSAEETRHSSLPMSTGQDARWVPVEWHIQNSDEWLATLAPGSQVWWNDPDCGISSGYYVIQDVLVEEDSPITNETMLVLKNEAGSSSEVFAHELSPVRPAALLPVVNHGNGEYATCGHAFTEAEAAEVGERLLGNENVKVQLIHDVTGPAWAVSSEAVHQVTVSFAFSSTGVPADVLRAALADVQDALSARGVKVLQVEPVTSDAGEPLTEDELADFMLERIESGSLRVEDIPLRLARYGLMEPSSFLAEMRERMEGRNGLISGDAHDDDEEGDKDDANATPAVEGRAWLGEDAALRNAFEATDEDIVQVLRDNAVQVANTNGVPFWAMAENILADWGPDTYARVAKAALSAGTSLDDQTTAAQAEIRAILVETGVLKR